MEKNYLRRRALLLAATGGLVVIGSGNINAADANAFNVHNLVSDQSGVADQTDPNLVNPWGLASAPTSPFWAANNGTETSTLYNGLGQANSLIVTVPGPPTGIVFNGGNNFNGDRFIFATEDGQIAGWRGGLGTTAENLSSSSAGAVYKGLAISTSGSDNYLFAADFHNNAISVFPSGGAPALPGNLTDPNLPSGYAPFNVQTIGNKLYVTYAQQDATGHDEVAGAGKGYVSVFNLDGTFSGRLISQGALDAPWGLAIAPAGFGTFGGDLLVGNFGDGRINVYDPATGAFIDTLKDSNGNPIEIDGLWALKAGTAGPSFDANSIYFTAGLDDEQHGLFGSISAPDGGGSTGLLLSGACLALAASKRKSQRLSAAAA